MTTANKILLVLVAVGLVVAGYMLVRGEPVSPPQAPQAGAVPQTVGDIRQLTTWFTNTVYFGSNPTATNGLNWANCALIASSFTVAASTTVAMDCYNPGARAGDFVLSGFGTTTVPGATTGSWRITGASASTTNDYDTIQIRNDTGTSNVIPSQIASSTRVLNIR